MPPAINGIAYTRNRIIGNTGCTGYTIVPNFLGKYRTRGKEDEEHA